jgi:hypothetical protein
LIDPVTLCDLRTNPVPIKPIVKSVSDTLFIASTAPSALSRSTKSIVAQLRAHWRTPMKTMLLILTPVPDGAEKPPD